MNILYCHDNVYCRAGSGQVFSQGQFAYSYWAPFLEAFGNLTVAGRGEVMHSGLDPSKMNISSGPDVDFALLPNMNSPAGLLKNRSKVVQEMQKLVAAHEGVIIRAVSEIGWIAYRHARAMNKPIAMEMAACAWDSTWNHGNMIGKFYAPVRYMRDKTITRHADFVIYVSQNFLQNRYPTNGQTISASNVRIDPIPGDMLDRRLSRIKTMEHGERPYVVGLIGNLNNRIKGVKDALKALAVIQRKRPGFIRFRHLGPGSVEPYRLLAEEVGIGDNVFFDGMMKSGPAVLEWLDDIDLYIQPSYQEGVPRAVIEAMSRGCPAIGSTAGGVPELLDACWLHRPGDYETLAALILKMALDIEVQIEAAGKNIARAESYTSTKLMPRRLDFWKNFAYFVRS